MKAVDTSVLIAAERDPAIRERLAAEDGLFVPALAAAEFLAGIRTARKEGLRLRAQDFYDEDLRAAVTPFTESQAQTLASLIVENKRRNTPMKMFDAAIAACAIDLACPLITHDSDFDVIDDLLELERL